MLCAVGLLGLVLLAPGPGRADGPTPQQRLANATRLLRDGDPRAAAEAFRGLAERSADPEIAAEALFRAAQLYDERLAQPAEGRRLYELGARRYPGSRFAGRSSRRAAELGQLLSAGLDPAALAELNEIAAAYGTLGLPTVIARLQRLLAGRPSPALADRATYLLGTAYRDSGHPAQADEVLQRLLREHPDSAWAPSAQQLLGDLALDRGDYAAARRRFERLAAHPDALWQNAARQGLAACARQRLRHLAAEGCWLYLALFFAGLAWRGRRCLFPLPTDTLYYLPVAGFLVVVTLLRKGLPLRPMLALAGGGALLTWLGGAAAGLTRRRPASLVLGLCGRALASVALGYLVLYHGHLLDRVLETWRMGPESG